MNCVAQFEEPAPETGAACPAAADLAALARLLGRAFAPLDDRAQAELYAGPFLAALDASASAAPF